MQGVSTNLHGSILRIGHILSYIQCAAIGLHAVAFRKGSLKAVSRDFPYSVVQTKHLKIFGIRYRFISD